VNTNDGEGVTELISACTWNSEANRVGPYSFTHALVVELQELGRKPSFSTGELYSNTFSRIQVRMPESGRERHPAPVHLVLTNESPHRRSVSISKREVLKKTDQAAPGSVENTQSGYDPEGSGPSKILAIPNMRGSAMSSLTDTTNIRADTPSPAEDGHETALSKDLPRLAFAIRLRDDFGVDQLSTDLFLEWLRNIPTIANKVKVEAGFHSFSSHLIVSIPVALSGYVPTDPAMISLGPITYSNLLQIPHHSTKPIPIPKLHGSTKSPSLFVEQSDIVETSFGGSQKPEGVPFIHELYK
jgi:hypothetical protein